LNVGVTKGSTVIMIGNTLAHCPALGVNVYVAVPEIEVLIVVGFQVPVIPFNEVEGNTGAVPPTQRAGIVLNVGTTAEFMVKVSGIVSVKQR
jgi:hypothetical protein